MFERVGKISLLWMAGVTGLTNSLLLAIIGGFIGGYLEYRQQRKLKKNSPIT
jgi:hypothetical protein